LKNASIPSQLLSQLPVIVYLAVENHRQTAVARHHRLRSSRRKIKNGESTKQQDQPAAHASPRYFMAVTEALRTQPKYPLIVRAAVGKSRKRAIQLCRVHILL
jgi:hypothetical protein